MHLYGVPYKKQQTGYTCGPAALRMVLEFFGKHKSERELSKLAGTSAQTGTSHEAMIDAVKKQGFHFVEKTRAKITDIRSFLADGFPVIVNYIEPRDEEGHYAVVVGMDYRNLFMNDPWIGKDFKISKKEFLARWRNKSGSSVRWLVTVASPAQKDEA